MECFLKECDCFPHLRDWCNINTSKHTNPYCNANEENCKNCLGVLCDLNKTYSPSLSPTKTPTNSPTQIIKDKKKNISFNYYIETNYIYGGVGLFIIFCLFFSCYKKNNFKDNSNGDKFIVANPIL